MFALNSSRHGSGPRRQPHAQHRPAPQALRCRRAPSTTHCTRPSSLATYPDSERTTLVNDRTAVVITYCRLHLAAGRHFVMMRDGAMATGCLFDPALICQTFLHGVDSLAVHRHRTRVHVGWVPRPPAAADVGPVRVASRRSPDRGALASMPARTRRTMASSGGRTRPVSGFGRIPSATSTSDGASALARRRPADPISPPDPDTHR
jgi:hypothetical protein